MNVQNSNQEQTMTSREIAELTDKEHKHVMRDIRDMISNLNSPNLDSSYKSTTYEGSNGIPYKQYELDKDLTLTLVLGYDVNARYKVVKRWQELEQEKVTQQPQEQPNQNLLPVEIAGSTFKSLLEIAELSGLSKNPSLLKANSGTAKATGIDFYDLMQIELKTEDDKVFITPTALGKEVGMSAIAVNKELEAQGYQARINKVWVPTDIGKPLSQVTEVQRSNSTGTSQQVKWSSELIEKLQ